VDLLLQLLATGLVVGRTSEGALVSRTVIVCVPLVALPHSSVTVQSRRRIKVPPQLLLMLSL